MAQATRTPSLQELDQYTELAHRLRNKEIARIGGRLFGAPRRLLKRARSSSVSGLLNQAQNGSAKHA